MRLTIGALLALMQMPLINAQTNPTADQFYVVPDDVSKYNLGEIIGNNRTVDTVIDPSNLKRAYQILYRTNSKGNIPDATVATVFVPAKPKKPAKLFSYQAPEDATVLDCATSYALLKDTSSNNSGLQPLAKQVIEYALSRGYYVVAPDAEGSQSAWLVGATEGQACLDAINATIRGLQLPAKTPVALFGYSGGAHTTVWASSLAAKYAPNLNIVGASYGGTPIDLRACFYKLNATPLALIAGGALFGLANGIPALRSYLVSEFNDIGRSDDKKFHDPGFCISKFIYAGFLSNDYLKDFNDPILARGTPASTIVDDESLLSNVSSKTIPVPKFPRLQYHSREDNVIPFDPAQAYVSQQCNTTTNLRLAFAAYPAGDHITTGNNVTYPLAFLRDALEGNLTTITCGQPY